MLQALIIDFGGVLSTPFDDSARQFSLAEGLEPTALRTAMVANAALVADLERGAITQAQFAEAIGDALRIFPDDLVERMCRGLQLRREVMDAVARVRRRGVKVAVLSNSVGSDPFDLYERFDLDRKVDVLVASDREKLRKPDPEIYRLTAGRLGIAPKDCVYADDSAKFLEPAAQLGMTTIHATDPAITIKGLADLFG